jgi:hypothetical protein
MTQTNNNTDGDAPDMLPVTCNICGEEAEHRVGIGPNERDSLVHWRGLCDEHLKELGEWWSE